MEKFRIPHHTSHTGGRVTWLFDLDPPISVCHGVPDSIMHLARVACEVFIPGIHFFTHGTLVWLFTCVSPHMPLQITFVCEPGRAKEARVWLLHAMPLQMVS